MIKIVAISDTHNQHRKLRLPPGDILIHAGDATNNGSEAEVGAFGYWMQRQPFRIKIFVPGNHDFLFETVPEMACQMLPGVRVLIDSWTTALGLKIHGTPWTPQFSDWAFMASEEHLPRYFERIPNGLDILISHGPPLGVLDQDDIGDHIGSRSLRNAVRAKKPLRLICGHVHFSAGVSAIEHTIVYNVASCGEGDRITREPLTLEVQPVDRISAG